MFVQNVRGAAADTRLKLTWEVLQNGVDIPRAICISVAMDMEFTAESTRFFLLPAETRAVQLDTGAGAWYYRVGVVLGTERVGSVSWSGTYGPLRVVSTKGYPPLPPARLRILGRESTQEGVRIETGLRETYYVYADISMDAKFRSGFTRTVYLRDTGKGLLELDGLRENQSYYIRLRTVAGDWSLVGGAASEEGGGAVETLSAPVELHDIRVVKPVKQALGPAIRGTVDAATRQTTGGDQAVAAAARVLLREAQDKPVQRFSSHADYLRMVQAQTVSRVGR